MQEGTTRTQLDPETGKRFVALRRQLGVPSFGLNHYVLQPGGEGDHHDRDAEAFAGWGRNQVGVPPQELPLPADLDPTDVRA